jgi:hypothetical protein
MKSDDALNPFCIFSGFFALYNGLLLIRLSSSEVQSRLAYPVSFGPEGYFRAGLLSAVSSITLAFTWLLFKSLGIQQALPTKETRLARGYYSAGLLGVLIGFLAQAVAFWQAGGVIEYLKISRVEMLDADSPHAVSIPAAPFVVAGLSLMTYAAGPHLSRAKLLWTSIVIWMAFLLAQGDRRPILQSVLAILFTWSIARKKALILRLSSVVTLLLVYIGAVAIAQLRFLVPAMLQSGITAGSGVSLVVSNITIDFIMPENTEFGGPYLSMLSAVSSDSKALYGGSYITGFLNVIPRSVYPGTKPATLGQAFAQQLAPGAGAAPGWGFNPEAEAYMNFGWSGVIVVMLLWSLFFIALNRLRDLRPLGLIIGAAIVSEAINVNRIDFSNVCTESLQCVVAALIVYAISTVLPNKHTRDVHALAGR